MQPLDFKVARIRRDLTHWELAKRCNIPPYILSRFERGRYNLSEEKQKRIRKALEKGA